jgi:hypothetical protein
VWSGMACMDAAVVQQLHVRRQQQARAVVAATLGKPLTTRPDTTRHDIEHSPLHTHTHTHTHTPHHTTRRKPNRMRNTRLRAPRS